ncbi:hypothetical protein [Nodosilinea sp. E11]|uniref:hypothetical protein n=1 Tax=Nodosilinea sp. E11 TaxID=3037479 RepID=UPI0029344053|nr:hypothetical protein [Nodosilinea sp. E11]WOD40507.1 hypothetical protein RRF56_06840 [Nodosilinea sp. E11]
MATDRLETAVRNFQHVNQMVERYTRLCRAYVNLSERFHQLDVDHMTLKGQVVPLLKALKTQQAKLQALEAEKAALQTTLNQQETSLQAALAQQEAQHRQELQQLTKTYEEKLQALTNHVAELQPLEQLLSADTHHELSIAEEQMELIEATLQEIEEDSSPDLSSEEKALLAAYRSDPAAFLVAAAPTGSEVVAEEPVAALGHYYYDEQVPEGFKA